jgi:hypothetical protein
VPQGIGRVQATVLQEKKKKKERKKKEYWCTKKI